MSAPTWLDEHDDDLGVAPSRPVPRPRHNAGSVPIEQLPQLPPPVVDERPNAYDVAIGAAAGNLPASSGARDPLFEQPRAGNLPGGPRPRIVKAPRPPLRADVLALILAAVVCVCVTVLALKGVAVPDVLQTIGFVAVGGAFGMAVPTPGRRP
jgi:hypothetical protein